MALLTKDQILAVNDRRFEVVPVPEWGGDVRVGTMTALQRDRYYVAIQRYREADGESESPSAFLVAACVVDDAGASLFGPDEVPALAAKSSVALDRVMKAASKLNALGASALEAEKGN